MSDRTLELSRRGFFGATAAALAAMVAPRRAYSFLTANPLAGAGGVEPDGHVWLPFPQYPESRVPGAYIEIVYGSRVITVDHVRRAVGLPAGYPVHVDERGRVRWKVKLAPRIGVSVREVPEK